MLEKLKILEIDGKVKVIIVFFNLNYRKIIIF